MADENVDPGQPKLPPKINLNGSGPESEEAAPPASDAVAPISVPQPPPKTRVNLPTSKSETTRIDLASAQAPIGKPSQEGVKKSTTKIDLAAGMSPLTEEDKLEAAKKSTVRVQIDEDKVKGDTTRLDTAAILKAQDVKKKTARIDLSEVLGGDEDIFKRRTALLDASKFAGAAPAEPAPPRTIRIKKPETAPTSILRPPPEAVEEEGVVEEIVQESEKKSETARIDLPPEVTEQPPTRRKTIRIKRPEGTVTSKPLILARSTEPISAPVERPAGEEEISPVFSYVALVAVLISCVLLYVLAAQTIATGLPFFGKI